VGVPLGPADLVDRLVGQLDDVKGVEADLGLGDRRADGSLVAGRHVDRDRPDRVLALAQLVEERLQRGGRAARLGPDDRADGVIGHTGQVALALAVANLVAADRDQPVKPGLVEVVADDALDDQPDRLPGDPEQPGDRRLGHLLREQGDDVLEVARVARARPGPRHRLKPRAAARLTPQAAQLALDDAAA